MTRNELPKVRKTYHVTMFRNGKTRKECWSADTLDGIWHVERIDDVGTPWDLIHLPSETLVDTFPTLTTALIRIARLTKEPK